MIMNVVIPRLTGPRAHRAWSGPLMGRDHHPPVEEDKHWRVALIRGEYVEVLGTSRPVRNLEVCAVRRTGLRAERKVRRKEAV